MPLFAVQYTYAPEKSAERDDHRTDHRAWLADLVRRHIVQSSANGPDDWTMCRRTRSASHARWSVR
ncbi:hypothetical protein GS469_05270 [Rhodococcus hoagii]|nr:hypothetical protein [Prescottella equi]